MNQSQRVGDIDVAWTESGEGPALVFIHGLAESRHTWSAQQAALGNFTTYAYDLRGHGETTLGDGDGTAEQLSVDLARFLDEVSGPAICVGFSLGGTVVLGAAATHPALITSAIVLGTSSVVGRAAAQFYDGRIALLADGMSDEFRSALRDDTAAALTNPAVDVDELTARRLEAIGDGAGYINAAKAMARVNTAPLTDLLPAIPIHVDVVGGSQDAFCPRKAADLLMAGLVDATYWELEGLGHLMNVDDPAAVTEVIEAILKEQQP
ncbi:MAG: alpha/beta fold hydrolase [Microthrixaceae bacterium]|nr:alpha/beta fold hydrolase [Microthrixaceae bacterium]